ncbi:MAG: hypothetical protein M3367_05685 [Acidobacteriota bacterium]|nr:hypothetical protein [Acidobacteriota bacterium]
MSSKIRAFRKKLNNSLSADLAAESELNALRRRVARSAAARFQIRARSAARC